MKRKLTFTLTIFGMLFILAFTSVPRTEATYYTGNLIGPYANGNVKGPGFTQIRFLGYSDGTAEYTALTGGSIDVMDTEVPTSSAPTAIANNQTTLNTYASQEYGWWGIDPDVQRSPTNYTSFRIAMNHLANLSSVASALIYGVPISTYVSPGAYGTYSLQGASPPNPLTFTIATSTARPTTGGFSGTISINNPSLPAYTNPSSHFYFSISQALATLKAGGFTEDGAGNWSAPNGHAMTNPSSCTYSTKTADGDGIVLLHRTDRAIMVAMYNAFWGALQSLNTTPDATMTTGWGNFKNLWCSIGVVRAQVVAGQYRDLDTGLATMAVNYYTSGWTLTTTPDFNVFTEHTPDNIVTDAGTNHQGISNNTFDILSEEAEFNNLGATREVQLIWALQALSYQNSWDGSEWSPSVIQAANLNLKGFLNSPATVQLYPGYWSTLNLRVKGGSSDYGSVLRAGLLGGFADLNYVTAHFVYDFEALSYIYDVANWAIDPLNKLPYDYASVGTGAGAGLGYDILAAYSGPMTNGNAGTHIRFTMRNDLLFHDGTHVTGQDVVFSYLLLKNKPVYAPTLGTLTNITATDTGDGLFRQIDLYALGQSFFALNLFNSAILPKHVWCGNDGYDVTKPTSQQGSGVICTETSSTPSGFTSISGWFNSSLGAYSNSCANAACTKTPSWSTFDPVHRVQYDNGTQYGSYTYNGITVKLTAMIGSGPFVWGNDYNPTIPTGTMLAFKPYILHDIGLDLPITTVTSFAAFLIPTIAALTVATALVTKRAKKI